MSTPSETPAAGALAPAAPRAAWRSRRDVLLERLGGEWRMAPVLLSLAGIWMFFAVQSDAFLTSRNLSNLTSQIAVTSIIALGLVLVLIVAEIDLSVAALSAVCGAVVAKLVIESDVSVVIAVLVGILVGAGIGAVQGAVVTGFSAPAFIVTLGGSLALQGLLLTLLPADTGLIPLVGTPLEDVSNSFIATPLGLAVVLAATVLTGALRWQSYAHMRQEGLAGSLARVIAPTIALGLVGLVFVMVLDGYRGVPTPIAVVLALLSVFYYLTTQTRFGTYLYAIGGNPEAARRAGISVGRVKLIAFVLVGALCAIGGIVASSRVLGVSAQSGESTLLLESVAAAVIGGASLFGGRGSVWAALLGALVIGSISNGMFLINASTEVRLVVQGVILVIAVVADAAISRGAIRR